MWRELSQELAGVIHIGAVNCGDDWNLCRMQGIRSYPTLVMYPTAEKYHGDRTTRKMVKFALKSIQSDAYTLRSEEEIKDNGLPWLISFCGDSGEKIINRLKTGQHHTWLIHFVEGDGSQDIEFRKLPAMLEGIKIGRVDCKKLRSECNELHVMKFPSFVVYKQTGGFELYYGRATAHDVSDFAKDSVTTKLESLTLDDFQSQRVGPSSQSMWFIDFFAPNYSTNSRSSPSRETDFDEYGQFGYALEPEYTEEELHEMEAAESS